MTEFVAKKLGEVLAFATIGIETLNKGREAFSNALGPEMVKESEAALLAQKDLIHAIADRAGVLKTVLGKLETTGEKLRKMRDLYVEEEWNNPTELLEWSGFFEGAAVVHSSLLQGAATEIGHAELKSLADQSQKFHKDLFEMATRELNLTGRQKASK